MTTRVVATLFVLIGAPAAFGQLACGDLVAKGEKVTLTADIGPCDGDSTQDAAVFIDGGTLDLAGHTITCADTDLNGDTSQGIALFGKKSKVMNGTVVGCQNGVFLTGNGKHLVQNVTAVGSVDDGFDTNDSTPKNKFLGNTATGSGNDGFSIFSDKNKLIGNTASQNLDDGFDVFEGGDKNKLVENSALDNEDDGIHVSAQKTKITNCTATGNDADGIDMANVKNTIRGGTASGNADYDVEGCDGNKVKGLTAPNPSASCQ